MKYKISILDQSFEIEIGTVSGDVAAVTVDNIPYMVNIENLSTPDIYPSSTAAHTFASPTAIRSKSVAKQAGGGETVIAPIPGIILSISVNVGDSVTSGQVVAIMEAMKMENNLISHVSGTVKEICTPKGTEVGTGDVVMVIG